MHELVDDFIEMNKAGLVLELCEKHYDENVIMLNNGTVFAESMHQAYGKQKEFVNLIIKFDVKLVLKAVSGSVSYMPQ